MWASGIESGLYRLTVKYIVIILLEGKFREEQMKKTVHIINGFNNPYGGSELEAIDLSRILENHAEVTLWSTSSRAAPELKKEFGIRSIGIGPENHPNGGVYIFVGSHWRHKMWPYLCQPPERLIYIFNTFHPKILALTSCQRFALQWPKTEYVMISWFQKTLLGIEATVHPSPINIRHFQPSLRRTGESVVIGRLSRDNMGKHHCDDISLYRSWSDAGVQIRLQGATCLSDQLQGVKGVSLSEEGSVASPEFLHGLDIFFYRTGEHVETFGRVVFEAMACALPVVCHRHGGYAEWITHGENGFLFESNEEAAQIVHALRHDAALRQRVGQAARATAERMYSPQALMQRARFYVDDAVPPLHAEPGQGVETTMPCARPLHRS